MKKQIIIFSLCICILFLFGFENSNNINSDDIITLYSQDGQIIFLGECDEEELNEYLQNNWSKEPYVLMYAADGRTEYVLESKVNEQQTVGWYLEPVRLMYAVDGRTLIVKQSEIDDYKKVGWFLSKEDANNQLKKENVNNNDVILLARVIYAEASDCNDLDRKYVAVVVMNRLDSGIWGNSISKIIYAKGQYSCVNNRKFNSTIPQECLDIAKEVLTGERYGVPKNVIFQSRGKQGVGVWKKVGSHYYCYGII